MTDVAAPNSRCHLAKINGLKEVTTKYAQAAKNRVAFPKTFAPSRAS
jgi:hypothetical protein